MEKGPKRKQSTATKVASRGRVPVVLAVVGVAIILVIVGKGMLRQEEINPGDPPEVQFDQALAQNRVIFALFRSKTCVPCMEMGRIAAEVMPEFAGRVVFIEANVYDKVNANLLQRMRIRVIPTTYIYDRTGTSKVHQGVLGRQSLRAALQAALSK